MSAFNLDSVEIPNIDTSKYKSDLVKANIGQIAARRVIERWVPKLTLAFAVLIIFGTGLYLAQLTNDYGNAHKAIRSKYVIGKISSRVFVAGSIVFIGVGIYLMHRMHKSIKEKFKTLELIEQDFSKVKELTSWKQLKQVVRYNPLLPLAPQEFENRTYLRDRVKAFLETFIQEIKPIDLALAKNEELLEFNSVAETCGIKYEYNSPIYKVLTSERLNLNLIQDQ